MTNHELTRKIARLVEERGWNQEDFSRIADLNRQTVRDILQGTSDRKLRNATVGSCAKALGLSVSELRDWPLDRLLPRMHHAAHSSARAAGDADPGRRRLYERATQPELVAWIERNPDRAAGLTEAESDELLSLQGTGGPLTSLGVEHFVGLITRKRRLIEQVEAIAGTEYLDLLEQLVGLMYEKVQPYADRR